MEAVLDLPVDVVRAGGRLGQERFAPTARGPHQFDLAQRPIADLLDDRLPGDTVAALQAHGDLEIASCRFLAGGENPVASGRIGRKRLLQEDVDALAHRVFKLPGAAVSVSRKHCHVTGAQAVDRPAEGVETGKPLFGRNRHAVAEPLCQHVMGCGSRDLP